MNRDTRHKFSKPSFSYEGLHKARLPKRVQRVAVHTLDALRKPGFMQSFIRKGRFAELMARIPIHGVVSQAALAGAAAYGLETGTQHFDSQVITQLRA